MRYDLQTYLIEVESVEHCNLNGVNVLIALPTMGDGFITAQTGLIRPHANRRLTAAINSTL